ncbi:IS3 family transposase [Enterococcus faecalis]|nr:IS3 family transposase [Enterococcus faecalis]MDN3100715.1 IS3 family transposase [Enterococcus faecalis]MDN3103383.1 IS3 family transposase [Enterococcus faecalis]
MKHTLTKKLIAVNKYLNEEHSSYRTIGTELSINPSDLRDWVGRYEIHGIKGLMPTNEVNYTIDFKRKVIEHMLDNKLSFCKTANLYNLPSRKTLKRWFEAYKDGTLKATKARRPSAMNKEKETIKIQAILELKEKYRLKDLLLIANIPKSTYYYWVKKLNQPDKYSSIKIEILKICKESYYSYGYRRVTLALRNKGIKINHKTVRKLMKELNVVCKIRPKKYKSYKGTVGTLASNILNRKFQISEPNKKWSTDITEFKVLGEKIYLSPIIDLYNGEIISYTVGGSPSFSLITEMLKDAFFKIPDTKGIILHSDQGWHYQMEKYHTTLKKASIVQSMSRKGNCLDNSIIENFFGILKSEFYYKKEFKSVKQFIQALHEYIYWYNNSRIKQKLNGLSPVQYRRQSA